MAASSARAITRRRTRCQSNRRDSPSPTERAPQLTRTDPSRKAHPQQSHAPAKPEQNHCDYHEEASAGGPHGQTRKRGTVAERHFQSNLSRCTSWHVVGRPISHNVNTVLLQRAPNLLNLLLIHTTNTNATVDLTVTVLHDFKLKRDTIQTKNDFPAQ